MRPIPACLLALLLGACGGDNGSMPLDAGSDTASGVCSSDSECADGVFCNGAEICDPGHPAAGEDGCLAGSEPCLSGQTCDEGAASCTTDCGVSRDADGDGHDAALCGGDDCDDGNADRFPGNTEVCDSEGTDEDCDPSTLGDDSDGDGEIDAACCNLVEGTYRCGTDCNDALSSVGTGGTEVCNGLDEDCDGSIDEGVLTAQFADFDGDGFGNDRLVQERVCDGSPLWTSVSGDCDDANPAANPDAAEICDGIDNNCDAQPGDEIDIDRDGVLDPTSTCDDTDVNATLPKDDCDDLNATTFPGAPEQCNDRDDDCDATIDERTGALGADAYCNDRFANGAGFCGAVDGSHVCVLSSCPAGRADCDGNQANGCEADLISDARNCGDCGVRCRRTCTAGLCSDTDLTVPVDVSLNKDGGCLVRASGRLECWGEPYFIPLGNRPTAMFDAAGLVEDAVLVETGEDRVYFVRGDGLLYVIGEGSPLPLLVPGVPATVSAMVARDRVVCVVASGSVYCGQGSDLANANVGTDVADLDVRIDPRSIGSRPMLCVVRDDGSYECFDCDQEFSSCAPVAIPEPPLLPAEPVVDVALYGTLGLSDDPDLSTGVCLSTANDTYCNGELERPVSGRIPFTRPEGARFRVCGLTDDGRVLCVTRRDGPTQAECDSWSSAWGPVPDPCPDLSAQPTHSPAHFGGEHGAYCSGEVDNACPGSCVGGVCGHLSTVQQYYVRAPRAFANADDGRLDSGHADLIGATSVTVAWLAGCAIAEGDVYCWGESEISSGLGVGPTSLPLSNPQRAVALVVELVSGRDHACARRDDGTVACWGGNGTGQLGRNPDGQPMERNPVVLAPLTVLEDPAPPSTPLRARRVAAGQGTTCALELDGTVLCWGDPTGMLGATLSGERFTVTFPAALGALEELSISYWHGCARHADGSVSCWGSSFDGEIGPNAATTTPVSIPLPAAAVEIQTAGETVGDGSPACVNDPYTCALLVDGRVACWGSNRLGNLGTGDTLSTDTPTIVPGIDSAVDLSTGIAQACAVLSDGRVLCWGADIALVAATGEVCNAPTQVTGCAEGPPLPCTTTPYEVPNIRSAVRVETGLGAACAELADGTVTCWGINSGGEAGDGTTLDRRVPGSTVVLPATVSELTVGSSFSCASVVTGEVLCWGRDDRGERGDGAQHPLGNALLPTLLPGL